MKTILFTYESPAGTFWIRPEPAGRVQLGIDRHKLKTYGSPTAAQVEDAPRGRGYDGRVTGVRIDKWLWAARFFKTRSLAARACELGRVHAKDVAVKPAREVHVGDMLKVKNDSGEFVIEVLGLSELRGPAPVAQALYRETEESKAARERFREERKSLPFFEALPEGKPSKRDRRRFDRLRERW